MSHRIANPRRFAPLVAVAVLALTAGVVSGAGYVPGERRTIDAYTAAWERGDPEAMYALLSDATRRRTSFARFERSYRESADALTLKRVRAGTIRGSAVPVTLETRLFGTLTGSLTFPTGEREDADPGVEWRAELVFPGLRRGEKLRRETTLPERGSLQARDGSALPDGLAGEVGPATPELATARGFPEGAPVGLTGLEREFDERLAGTAGGVLFAGERELARAAPKRGRAVRTTIDPKIQAAAVQALAGRYGGIAVVRPRSGEVLALAGIAQSAPQPPGSTFKIVTLAGVLEAKVAKRTATFPVQTAATIEGVEIQNANGESCGGSLRASFAHSCNSVFAPLGAQLGAERLVAAAERFGFNEGPPFASAAPSTIPPAAEIGDDLAVGSTAIGQGKVLATPLQMALVAATIGADGMRPHPTLLKGADPRRVRATSKSVARTIKSYMHTVITDGTGGAAAVPGVKVAGKTGTAELRTTVREEPVEGEPEEPPPPPDPTDTDAWFVAFAPLAEPRVAVAVLLVGHGAGGTTAAPAARVVLEAAL